LFAIRKTHIMCHFWQNAKNITTRYFCKNRRILTFSAFPQQLGKYGKSSIFVKTIRHARN